jgi:site-specific DNA recombinase
MRWNDQDKWIYSEQIVHPAIVDEDTFGRAQDLLGARRGARAPHKPHKSRHAYALPGLLFCGLCNRRMQGHWANAAPYYRCRFPAEYALANRVSHPLNVTLRQDALLGPLDEWLASKFEPCYLSATIDELTAAATGLPGPPPEDEINVKIAECGRKLAQYRAALDAGAEPVSVARWITETQAELAKYEALKRAAPPQASPSMNREEISSVVSALSDLLAVLRAADPADKADIYSQLGLRLTYQPGDDPAVRAEVRIASAQHWQFEGVRGGNAPINQWALTGVFAVGDRS